MEKHIPLAHQQKFLYWSNDTNPAELNLNGIDLTSGVFIKIVDRSVGGANEVFYATNKKETLTIINELHKKFKKNNKHIFVIEPAYVTIKQHNNKDYNATGRAFVSFIYDQNKKILDVKIAAAKWMFPLAPIQRDLASEQMLSNLKNCIKMVDLTCEELEILSSGLQNTYAETVTAGLIHDDLISYCSDHPQMKIFTSCLRPNSSYSLVLDVFYHSKYDQRLSHNFLTNQIASLIYRDLKDFYLILESLKPTFFMATKPTLDDLIKKICVLYFFENYVAHLKVSDTGILKDFPFLTELVDKEILIKSTLNRMILKYLSLLNHKYDIQCLNRSLRQAAATGDTTVMKLLIYTRRADVNDLSLSYKTALDYALTCKKEIPKQQALNLLKQVNAETGQELLEKNSVERKIFSM